MKKYFAIAAAAALVLAGCAKVENFSKENDSQRAINFSNYAPKALAKADAANYAASTSLIVDADFDVWAWYVANGDSFDGSQDTKYFSNWYTVSYKGDGAGTSGENNLYPDGARYWPTGDTPDKLSFFAYYPSNAGTITAPATGLGAFSFTAEAAAADQVDFMVADVVKDQVYGATNATVGETKKGTVNLTFKHQLTKVQVKFKTTQAIVDDAKTDIKVQSASFGNIVKSGTLTSSYNGTATSTAWSDNAYVDDDAKLASYTIPVNASTALTATATNYGDDETGIFLLVPQTMLANTNEKAQYITVTWNVITDGITTTNTKKIYLDDCVTTDGGDTAANIDWDKNNFVTYVITIAPNQILFTGAAEEWDAETFGYYRVF